MFFQVLKNKLLQKAAMQFLIELTEELVKEDFQQKMGQVGETQKQSFCTSMIQILDLQKGRQKQVAIDFKLDIQQDPHFQMTIM